MSKRRLHQGGSTARRSSRHQQLPKLIALLSLAVVAAGAVALVVLARPGAEAAATARADATPHTKGSPNAPVTVIEWGDFQ